MDIVMPSEKLLRGDILLSCGLIAGNRGWFICGVLANVQLQTKKTNRMFTVRIKKKQKTKSLITIEENSENKHFVDFKQFQFNIGK